MKSDLTPSNSPGSADLQNILGAFFSKLDLSPPSPSLVTTPSKKTAKGGGGSKIKGGKPGASPKPAANKDKDFEPPETPLEPVQDPEPPKKEKVTLSRPKWEVDKPGFNEETPISVEVLLPEEHAAKTKVTFELFAKTPKGPERICGGEAHAKNGKATCPIPLYIPSYKDENGNRPQKVEYYFTAKHSESELLDGSTTPKVVEEMAEKVLEIYVLEDVTFATNQSFIRTSEAADLKALGEAIQKWKSKHPEGKLGVFGHADAVGQEASNKTLSERRGKSVHAFLAKDPKPWEELYGEEKWGLARIQELLKHLGHDPGTVDGKDGPKTQAAIKDFQGSKGLPATGNADATTREALFMAYFESANSPGSAPKDFDSIAGKPFTGCSEFNLVENTQGASEANRRVTVLLLKVSKNFPIQYPCKSGDIKPCQSQANLKGERRTPGFRCRFYDNLVNEVAKKQTGNLPDYDPGKASDSDPGCGGTYSTPGSPGGKQRMDIVVHTDNDTDSDQAVEFHLKSTTSDYVGVFKLTIPKASGPGQSQIHFDDAPSGDTFRLEAKVQSLDPYSVADEWTPDGGSSHA